MSCLPWAFPAYSPGNSEGERPAPVYQALLLSTGQVQPLFPALIGLKGLALCLSEHLLSHLMASLSGDCWARQLSFIDAATGLSPEGPRTAPRSWNRSILHPHLPSLLLLPPALPNSSSSSSQHSLSYPLPFHASLLGRVPAWSARGEAQDASPVSSHRPRDTHLPLQAPNTK